MVARRKAALRAVTADEGAPQPARAQRAKSVAEAARGGTRLELLEAMRDRIARALSAQDCPTKDLSPLTRRLQELERDIAGLKGDGESPASTGSDDDEVDDSFDASAI